MNNKSSFGKRVIKYNNDLAQVQIKLPDNYRVINPYNGDQKEAVNSAMSAFYNEYFNDNHKRRLILGSSPARRGSAKTGIPFEDLEHLQLKTNVKIDDYHIQKTSSNFLFEVINNFGGIGKFYKNFYLNFVCPLGLARINEKKNEVNCNYYENKNVQKLLLPLIIDSLKKQIDFGIDTTVCYCIGSSDNYRFLGDINDKYNFFDKIVPLEHPRYITQYNSKKIDFYMKKYLDALNGK